MAIIDLDDSIPEELAETAALDDLLETALKTDQWNDRMVQVLDYIYRQRLDRALRFGRTDDIQALLEHLDRMTHPRVTDRLDRLETPCKGRWAGYMDILEDRLTALASPVPEQLMSRSHVAEIVEMIGGGDRVYQSDIRKARGLRPANLTRILNLMEANELIIRRAEGRRKRIELGPLGREFYRRKTDETRTETDEIREKRGIDYFRLGNAA